MRLSDDKVNHLSHVVMKNLKAWEMVQFAVDENDVRLAVKEGIVEGLHIIGDVENKVKKTLHSYSRKILEGSREWDVMFSKAFEEELQKIAHPKE